MRNIFFILLLGSALVSSVPAIAQSQATGQSWRQGAADSCLPLDELDLSREQKSAIIEVSGSCRDHLFSLRTVLVGKRLELKRMLSDPSITEEEIEEAWKEIESLNVSMYREVKAYTLSIRRILTPEQIKDWCALVETHPRRGWR